MSKPTDWLPVEFVTDALGNKIVPGSSVVYPLVSSGQAYLQVACVIQIGEVEDICPYQQHPRLFPRLRVLGVRSNYQDDPATWATYEATIERVDRVLLVHPEHFNGKLRWLEKQAQEKGLP